MTLTGTDVGDTATYKCNSGFRLEGDRFRVCQSSGDWSGQAPSCKGESDMYMTSMYLST